MLYNQIFFFVLSHVYSFLNLTFPLPEPPIFSR